MAKNAGARSKRPKMAMVAPAPARPDELPIFADPALHDRLLRTLKAMKNNRSYTVIEYHKSWASVHFEGDLEPKTITYTD